MQNVDQWCHLSALTFKLPEQATSMQIRWIFIQTAGERAICRRNLTSAGLCARKWDYLLWGLHRKRLCCRREVKFTGYNQICMVKRLVSNILENSVKQPPQNFPESQFPPRRLGVKMPTTSCSHRSKLGRWPLYLNLLLVSHYFYSLW